MNNNPFASPEEAKQNSARDWQNIIITALIGIAIGFGLGYFVFANKTLAPSSEPTINNDEAGDISSVTTIGAVKSAASNEIAGQMSIVVDDQNPGQKVMVKSLTLSEPAWVVTFNSTEDNSQPLRIIGAQYFQSGQYEDVSAYVAEGIVADRTYFVALYRDDGLTAGGTLGGHVFSSETDRPFIKAGQWIMDSFTTLSTGSRG